MRALSRVSYSNSVVHNMSFLGSLDMLCGVALPRERFTGGITDDMICLACERVSPDPVYLLCCHNKYYCYKCLVGDRKDCPTIVCPSCTVPVNSKTLTRNDTTRSAVYSLKTVICEHSDAGCKVLSSIDTISDHVDSCLCQPVPCENKSCDQVCLLKDWTWHCKVKCPKRVTRCVGSCHSFITAEEVDTHDCDNVLRGYSKYREDELEILCRLFRDEHPDMIVTHDLIDPANAGQNFSALARKFSALKFQLQLLNRDDDKHDQLGRAIHHGSWRCSVLDCKSSYCDHDFRKTFPDGNRHIYFWDCCLNDNQKTVNCDVLTVED